MKLGGKTSEVVFYLLLSSVGAWLKAASHVARLLFSHQIGIFALGR